MSCGHTEDGSGEDSWKEEPKEGFTDPHLVPVVERMRPSPEEVEGYQRYRLTESGISPMGVPGFDPTPFTADTDHDLDFKTKHVRRFLEEGNKVKITVRFRGREITHPETARRQIDLIVEAVDEVGSVETPPRLEGRTMTAILAPRVKVQHTR